MISQEIRNILEFPIFFNVYQRMVGASRAHKIFVEEYVQPSQGVSILDVGCGTGDIVKYIPDFCNYIGIDFNKKYIEKAKRKYGYKHKFFLADASKQYLMNDNIDICFCFGVLHHLDDVSCRNLLTNAYKLLKHGGYYVCIEPCYFPDQDWFKKMILRWDRGVYVRDLKGYESLMIDLFKNITVARRDDMLSIPYSMVALKCIKE
ncbi:MAG: class I SAM-dependent methyltransferase [Desulforudis sp.]|jgi:ubiquinone/menaquinone biosynthesis C-methylase UbiE|nr:MAG: class I SAM-dependent methyltransferase [Desulforudis sp.]